MASALLAIDLEKLSPKTSQADAEDGGVDAEFASYFGGAESLDAQLQQAAIHWGGGLQVASLLVPEQRTIRRAGLRVHSILRSGKRRLLARRSRFELLFDLPPAPSDFSPQQGEGQMAEMVGIRDGKSTGPQSQEQSPVNGLKQVEGVELSAQEWAK